MATLIVEKSLCEKSGDCVRICPAVFEFDSQGYAQVKAGANTADAGVETAISSCPTGAIYWE